MTCPTISVICIVLNEEQNLPGLLDRLKWADEVVVVDGGSCDATRKIASSRGARVFQRPFDNFARQQNFALSLARGDWVLSLDADERPTPEMIAEIGRRVREARCDAFRVRVRSSIFGRLMRFSGTQDDRQVRLVRRGRARWQGEVHETLEVAGAVGQLHSWLDHDPLPNLAAFLAKMHRYTTLAAEARVARRQPPHGVDAWLLPAREVFRRLIWKQGLWDGPQGWGFCLLSGLSEWVLADKHRRLWSSVAGTARKRCPGQLGVQRDVGWAERSESHRCIWHYLISSWPERSESHHYFRRYLISWWDSLRSAHPTPAINSTTLTNGRSPTNEPPFA